MTNDANDDEIVALLIEDSPDAVARLRAALRPAHGRRFRVEQATTMVEAKARLGEFVPDAILLTLGGQEAEPEALLDDLLTDLDAPPPILVLTDRDDEALGDRLIAQGAEDYLAKPVADDRSLRRALRSAVERDRLRKRIRQTKIAMAREHELSAIVRGLADTGQTSQTAHLYGIRTLREMDQDLFAELRGLYGDCLGNAARNAYVACGQ